MTETSSVMTRLGQPPETTREVERFLLSLSCLCRAMVEVGGQQGARDGLWLQHIEGPESLTDLETASRCLIRPLYVKNFDKHARGLTHDVKVHTQCFSQQGTLSHGLWEAGRVEKTSRSIARSRRISTP